VTEKHTAAKTARAPDTTAATAAAAAEEQDRQEEQGVAPQAEQAAAEQAAAEPAGAEPPAAQTGAAQPLAPLFGKAAETAKAAAMAAAPTDAEALRGRNGTLPPSRRRRSARLTAIKFVLPVIALVTVGYLVYWWYIHNREAVITVETPDKPSANPPMVTVNNFKYSSTDSQNRPYTITADSAAQPQDKAIDTIDLVRPQANFTLANSHWMTITAQQGTYHRNADTIDLSGNVTLDHDSGMTFHTSRAQIDMQAKVAAGSDPVQGQNATSEINSEGFKVLDDGDVIIFTGKTLLRLHGKGKDSSQ